MKFAPADIDSMIDGLADDVTIGLLPVRGVFDQSGKLVQQYDGSVATSGPLLILSETNAALVTENSTTITIGSTQYQATQKMPDGSGLVELELTKEF